MYIHCHGTPLDSNQNNVGKEPLDHGVEGFYKILIFGFQPIVTDLASHWNAFDHCTLT